MINENRSLFHVSDYAAVSETNFFKIFGETEHEEKNIDILSDFFGFRPFGTELNERISFGFGSVENLKLITSTKQMLAHAESHDSSSDPADDFLRSLHSINVLFDEDTR